MKSLSKKKKSENPDKRTSEKIAKDTRTKKSRLTKRDFPIVGIGASAGGLEAFLAFLKGIPNDTGMAFVFVQHQDPTHESSLSDLLRKAAPMPVNLVQDHMLIEPDTIYVIPPNSDMHISQGRLKLNPRRMDHSPHLPVDIFLKSLADYSQRKAIGVILSGTASDGTLGLKAIKESGGVTFAQDERSAKYNGMPRHAVVAEVVDFVLSPEKIAAEIGRIARHPLVRSETQIEEDLAKQNSSVLGQIFALLRKSSGVDFTHYKSSTVMRRITRRMLLHRVESLADYHRLLKETPKYVTALYEDILINVTSFFRDPETFEILKNETFPKIVKLIPDKLIRIWVPGCSSGEEPYSIAIALHEFLSERGKPVPILIFATDVSESAIEKARTGIYPHSISSDVSPERLRRYFTKTGEGYQINKLIRDLCIFARHNAVKDPPFSKIDLISCRNLLIYLDTPLQKKILPVFHYALNPNGYLMLGSSETIGNFSEYFFPADRKYKIYSKKAVHTKIHFDLSGQFGPEKYMTGESLKRIEELTTEKDILKEGDRLILTRFAPASVIVDENFDIIQFRGQTSPFLEHPPGQASFNIIKMAREGLIAELRSALLKAQKEKTSVQETGIPIQTNGLTHMISVEVTPFTLPRSSQYFYLVLFLPETRKSSSKPKLTQKLKGGTVRRRENEIQRLAADLAATKEYLQSIIEEQEASNEELRAANEEILSSNEELQSTNEEMETAKEELQSTNEELTTVNEELQVRNTELSNVNNDLSNLLASVYIPIIMLGSDLRIRRFTPMAEKVLNLIPSDVGRPISDINLNISVSDLSERILDVIDTVLIQDLEVQDKQGRSYSLQIRPYKTTENKIDGAVLVLIDIEALKKNVGFRSSEVSLQSILEMLQEPFVILDQSHRVKSANFAFYDTFKIQKKEFDGDSFFETLNGLWNIPKLRKLLDQMPMDDSRMEKLIVEHAFQDGKRKIVFHARALQLDGHRAILLAVKDKTNT